MQPRACLDKDVVDWHGRRLGRVGDVQRDPRTGSVLALRIEFGPEVRRMLRRSSVTLPVSYVGAVRREEVALDRGLSALARLELPPSG
jgi:sporulation protein YlmC with PRC-barrel domain